MCKKHPLAVRSCWLLVLALLIAASATDVCAEYGTVLSHQKISNKEGNFEDTFNDSELFGWSTAWLGDLDGDGVGDLAVGSIKDWGAVWILFMQSDGSVKDHMKISEGEGNFTGDLTPARFGASVASLGDLDGDGVGDIAVGESFAGPHDFQHGSVWVLFLNSDGTVKAHQEINHEEGGFTGILDHEDAFGCSLAALDDVDGDGVCDLAVGACLDDDGAGSSGAVWVLFLKNDGTVKAHQKISATEGNFAGVLDGGDVFGNSVASLGDYDGDGKVDIAVGATGDDDGGFNRGAVWLLYLNHDGTVKNHQKISATEGGFTGTLNDGDNFGRSVTSMEDCDRDGVNDLAVGAYVDSDGGYQRGAVWVLFLENDGMVKAHQKISDTEGDFHGTLDDRDWFGHSVASLDDMDGDGVVDIAVGALRDDDGEGPDDDRGAVWVLFLNSNGTVRDHEKISQATSMGPNTLDKGDQFGSSIASLGDRDGDGVGDIAVGAPRDDDGDHNSGAVWVLFLNSSGAVKSYSKISQMKGSFAGTLDANARFGVSLACLNDLDGDEVGDLAVGSPLDREEGARTGGSVWLLFLNADATVKAHQKINTANGGFTGTLNMSDEFGSSVASLGDLDGDGVGDLAVGARRDDDGGSNRGAVWVLFLNAEGTVKSHQKISDTEGNFTGILNNSDAFGAAVASLSDFDGDGVTDLAVGASSDDGEGENRGAVWMLFLNVDGTVKGHQKISETEGDFAGILDDGDFFGGSVAAMDDLDGDGVIDLAVGANGDNGGGMNRGAVWMLFLNADGTVKGHQKISETEGSFTGVLDDLDAFGQSLASLGDFDGDGAGDLAVGAPRDGDGGGFKGAVWMLFLKGEKIAVSAYLDILPGACPNPLNTHPYTNERKNGKEPEGVLPVALLGGPDFDVHDVNVFSLRLEGVAPLRHSYEDVSGPPASAEECACSEGGADGYTDLMLKFRRTEIVDAIGESYGTVEMALTGNLNDGSSLGASDCVQVEKERGKGDGPRRNASGSRAKLLSATPNPFNPATVIRYKVPEGGGQVTIQIYDTSGKLVRTLVNERQVSGQKKVTWHGRNDQGQSVATGVYFYRMTAPGFEMTRKMVLLK
jgi:hypothetical protein